MVNPQAGALAALVVAILAWQAKPATAEPPRALQATTVASELSAQSRRARTRITVRPQRQTGPLRRECRAVLEERWIPQWGGRVLYAGQDCWWTRAPLGRDEVF